MNDTLEKSRDISQSEHQAPFSSPSPNRIGSTTRRAPSPKARYATSAITSFLHTIPQVLRAFKKSLTSPLAHCKHNICSVFTPLGWFALVLGLLSATGFAYARWHELLSICVVNGCLLIAAALMSLGNIGLQTTLHVPKQSVSVGDDVNITVTVRNPYAARTTNSVIDIPLGDLSRHQTVPPLAPHNHHDIHLRYIACSRSVATIGPLALRKGDPFGLIRHKRLIGQPSTIYIHPQIVALPTIQNDSFSDPDGEPSNQVVDDDMDFHGLREYHIGDDMRHVHWLSSSRAGTMMLRQYTASQRTQSAIIMDSNPDHYENRNQFELAVSTYASIGVRCLQSGNRIFPYAGADRQQYDHEQSNHGQSQDIRGFLDSCSAIQPQRNCSTIPTLFSTIAISSCSLVCVVIGERAPLENLEQVLRPCLPHTMRIVVRITSSRSPGICRKLGFLLFTINQLDDLPQLLHTARSRPQPYSQTQLQVHTQTASYLRPSLQPQGNSPSSPAQPRVKRASSVRSSSVQSPVDRPLSEQPISMQVSTTSPSPGTSLGKPVEAFHTAQSKRTISREAVKLLQSLGSASPSSVSSERTSRWSS